MKPKFFLLLIVVIVLCLACKQPHIEPENTYIGRWAVVALYIDYKKTNFLPLVGSVEPCLEDGGYLEFFSDMTFDLQSTCTWMRAVGNYTFEETTITATDTLNTEGVHIQTFTFENGYLTWVQNLWGHHVEIKFRKLEDKSRYDVIINLWDTDENNINHLKPDEYQLIQSVTKGGNIVVTAPEIDRYIIDQMQSPTSVTFTDVQVDNNVDFVYKRDNTNDIITLDFLSGLWSVDAVYMGGNNFTTQAQAIFPCIMEIIGEFTETPQNFNITSSCAQFTSQSGTYTFTGNQVTIILPSQTLIAERNGNMLFLNMQYEGFSLQLRLHHGIIL
jgi:hypothetical protein